MFASKVSRSHSNDEKPLFLLSQSIAFDHGCRLIPICECLRVSVGVRSSALNFEKIQPRIVGRIPVHVLDSNEALGGRAADDLAAMFSGVIDEQGRVAVILPSANSQLTFLHALRVKKAIDWGKVVVFHMDEYLGTSDQHPASFARFIRQELVDLVHPSAFYSIMGNSPDLDSELDRYADLLRRYPPDLCVLGIGENGHLAFNDPPADFETKEAIHVVSLDVRCRMQQVNEGHFAALEDVPEQAITLTVPALLAAKHVLAVVPEARKAAAVKAALEGPVTPDCPASILHTQPHVTMYLDQESASLLS
jgi:glucosamine-6-phosphate deaminase